jgi:hypothetical protein
MDMLYKATVEQETSIFDNDMLVPNFVPGETYIAEDKDYAWKIGDRWGQQWTIWKDNEFIKAFTITQM